MSFVISPIYPALKVEIGFQTAGTYPPTWTDVSSYVTGTTAWRRGRTYELGQADPGSASVSLLSINGEFNPFTALMLGGYASPYDPWVIPRRLIRFSTVTAAGTFPRFTGVIKRWRQRWSDEAGFFGVVDLTCCDLTYLAQQYVYTADPAYPQERSDQRISRVLTAIGTPAALIGAMGTGDTIGASSGFTSRTALSVMQSAANDSLGVLLTTGSGQWKFQSRAQRFAAGSGGDAWGETANRTHYEPGLTIDLDDTYIYNDVKVTSTASAFTSQVSDATSQTEYGICALPTISTALVNAADITGMASTLLANYKAPHPRIGTISVEAKSKGMGVTNELGGVIDLSRFFSGRGASLSLSVYIDALEERVTKDQWLVTLTTSPIYTSVTY